MLGRVCKLHILYANTEQGAYGGIVPLKPRLRVFGIRLALLARAKRLLCPASPYALCYAPLADCACGMPTARALSKLHTLYANMVPLGRLHILYANSPALLRRAGVPALTGDFLLCMLHRRILVLPFCQSPTECPASLDRLCMHPECQSGCRLS